jgi:hypothetical protein
VAKIAGHKRLKTHPALQPMHLCSRIATATLPSPPLRLVLVLSIHLLVLQSGLEFPIDKLSIAHNPPVSGGSSRREAIEDRDKLPNLPSPG